MTGDLPVLPYDQWVFVCAFLTSILTAIVSQVYWPRWAKAATAFVFAFVTSLVGMALRGALAASWDDPWSIVLAGLSVFVITIPVYEGLLEPIGINKLNAATSLDHERAETYMAIRYGPSGVYEQRID